MLRTGCVAVYCEVNFSKNGAHGDFFMLVISTFMLCTIIQPHRHHLMAGVTPLAVMAATKWHGELVVGLHANGAGLSKAVFADALSKFGNLESASSEQARASNAAKTPIEFNKISISKTAWIFY
jgi:hypothetical protein